MKAQAEPGGATKGAGIAGASVEVKNLGFKPDIYSGISFGSIACVPLAIGMDAELLKESATLQLRKFFKVPPTTKNGKITGRAILRAAWSFVSRSNKFLSLGVQDIEPILTKFITREKFLDYQRSSAAPCFIMAVEFQSNTPVVWNVKDKRITFQEYLAIVKASSRIPVMTQPMMIQLETIAKALNYDEFLANWKGNEKKKAPKNYKFMFYDGGLVDHNMGKRLFDLCKILPDFEPIDEMVSIYPRPSGFHIPPMPAPKNIIDVMIGTIENQKMEVSREDEQNERDLVASGQLDKKKLHQIFLPWILDSLYDVDNNRLQDLQDQSILETRKQYKAA